MLFFFYQVVKKTVLNSFYGFFRGNESYPPSHHGEFESAQHLTKSSSSRNGLWWSPQTLGLQLSPTLPQLLRSLKGQQFIPCPPGGSEFQPYLNNHCPPLLAFQITKLPVLVEKKKIIYTFSIMGILSNIYIFLKDNLSTLKSR